MTTASLFPDADPMPFVLWHRPNVKGARWRIVGRCRTHLEAVVLMSGSGEFRIEERPADPTDARPDRRAPAA